MKTNETRRCEWCGDIAQGACGCPAETEIARLRAALAAAEQDVTRYHWLRGRVPGGTYRIIGVVYSDGGDGVDAAIDEAMASKLGAKR